MLSAVPNSPPDENQTAQLQQDFVTFLTAVAPIGGSIPAFSNNDGIQRYLNDSRSAGPLANAEYVITQVAASSDNSSGLYDFFTSQNVTDVLFELMLDGLEAATIIDNEFTPETTTTTSSPDYFGQY